MSRELRMVRHDWKHPKGANGRYLGLFEGCIRKWEEGRERWEEGFVWSYNEDDWIAKNSKHLKMSYEDHNGPECSDRTHMPDWTDEEKTHFQMYETTSEGTPISPVFDNKNDLAQWLVDNNASRFGSVTATYDQWMSIINSGWVPSFVMSKGKIHLDFEGLE